MIYLGCMLNKMESGELKVLREKSGLHQNYECNK